jgi:hypothetical protein
MNDFVAKPVEPELCSTPHCSQVAAGIRRINPAPARRAAGDRASGSFRQRLANVAGLDVRQGLLGCSRGRAEVYARLLAIFIDSHAADPATLAPSGPFRGGTTRLPASRILSRDRREISARAA